MHPLMRQAAFILLLAGASACGGGGAAVDDRSIAAQSAAGATAGLTSRRTAAGSEQSSWSYSAPWGGFGATGIYLQPQSACGYIPASTAAGYSWPSFLSTLAAGTTVTVYGTPTYDNSWSQTNNCPTGGIVATSVVLGAPSSSPAPTPPGGGGGSPAFGQEPPNFDPGANWRPYSASSTWNQRLSHPDGPTLDPNDASKVYAMFNGAYGPNQYQGRIGVPYASALAQGTGNGGFPFYFAKSSDPQIRINCTAGWGTCALQGQTFNVPARAASAQDGDRHMVVIQPNGTELDVWSWGINFGNGSVQNPPWTSGEVVNVGWGGTANVSSGNGWDLGTNGLSAAGNDGLAGVIREPEIASGQINHALNATIFCSPTTTPVYPASHSSGQNNCNGFVMSSNQVVATGNRLWFDLTDSQINSLSQFNNAQKVVLHALHDYGAFVTDYNGYEPLSIAGVESQMPGYTYGNDVVGSWASANLPQWFAWNGVTWYDTLSANDMSQTIQSHIHVLAPCVNTGYPGGQC